MKTSTYKQIQCKKTNKFNYNKVSVNTYVIYHQVDLFSSKTSTAYMFITNIILNQVLHQFKYIRNQIKGASHSY